MPRRRCFALVSLNVWLPQSFPWWFLSLRGLVCDTDVPSVAEHSTNANSLQLDQWWVSVFATIPCTKTLGWVLKMAVIYGQREILSLFRQRNNSRFSPLASCVFPKSCSRYVFPPVEQALNSNRKWLVTFHTTTIVPIGKSCNTSHCCSS